LDDACLAGESEMTESRKHWIKAGIIAASVIGAAALAVGATKGLRPASDVLGAIEQKADDPAAGAGSSSAQLLADIEVFRKESARLAPEAAASHWFALYDRAVKLGPPQLTDISTYDAATQSPVGAGSLLAALPAPEAWPALRAEASRRAAVAKPDSKNLALRYLAEVLNGDRDAAFATLSAIERTIQQLDPSDREGTEAAIRDARWLLASLYGSADQQLAAFQESLLKGAEYEDTSIPDLVALVGEPRATELLRDAVLSPTSLQVKGGAATRALVRKLAIADISRMRVPQWSLVDDVDAAPLYVAISKRFPSADTGKPENEMFHWRWQQAALYYFLAMVKDGNQAEAEKTLAELAGQDDISIPRNAVDALQRAKLNDALYRFLHGQLERRPELRAWGLYIEQAAYTGHSADALALIERLLARKDLPDFVSAELRARRVAALLASDKIDAAAAGYRALLAEPPARNEPGLATREAAALNAAAVGRLLERKDLKKLGLDFARRSVAVRSGEGGAARFDRYASLVAELRRQGLDAEAQAFAVESLQVSKAPARGFEALMPGANLEDVAALTELVGLYSAAGRHEDVLKLLNESTRWNVADLGELLEKTDSLGVPLGASVAASLDATGDREAAVRVVRATVLKLPGRDAGYELLARLDANAVNSFEALYASDEFEERPLIWKARAELTSGKLAEAEATVRRAIAIDPSDGEEGPNDRMRAYAVLSEILRRKGARQEAELFASAVAAIRLSERGDQFYYAGLYDRAFKTYRDALELFSDAYCIQSRLAVQLNKQGRRKEALEHYRRAYELMPDSFGRVESHCFGCESVFQDVEAQGIAERVFTDVIKASPGKAQAHYLLAYLRETQGDHAGAVQPLRSAVGIDGRYLNAWKRLYEIADHTFIEPGERDIATLKLLELDPLQRHTHYSVDEVGRLDALWRGVARARDFAAKSAAPREVFELPATAAARARLLAELPEEMRVQMQQMQALMDQANPYGMNVLSHEPRQALSQHELVKNAAQLLGVHESMFDY
jgi:tetratricopeptide (TPR) repeat protein